MSGFPAVYAIIRGRVNDDLHITFDHLITSTNAYDALEV